MYIHTHARCPHDKYTQESTYIYVRIKHIYIPHISTGCTQSHACTIIHIPVHKERIYLYTRSIHISRYIRRIRIFTCMHNIQIIHIHRRVHIFLYAHYTKTQVHVLNTNLFNRDRVHIYIRKHLHMYTLDTCIEYIHIYMYSVHTFFMDIRYKCIHVYICICIYSIHVQNKYNIYIYISGFLQRQSTYIQVYIYICIYSIHVQNIYIYIYTLYKLFLYFQSTNVYMCKCAYVYTLNCIYSIHAQNIYQYLCTLYMPCYRDRVHIYIGIHLRVYILYTYIEYIQNIFIYMYCVHIFFMDLGQKCIQVYIYICMYSINLQNIYIYTFLQRQSTYACKYTCMYVYTVYMHSTQYVYTVYVYSIYTYIYVLYSHLFYKHRVQIYICIHSIYLFC